MYIFAYNQQLTFWPTLYFNVRSKADIASVSIIYRTEQKTKKYRQTEKVKTTLFLRKKITKCKLELGRYRFFKSVSVFGFLVGFFKSRYRFRYRFFKIPRYRFRFSVFPHEPTIAYRITPSLTPYALPFSPNGVWALEFALQIAAIRDSDKDNL